MIRNIFCRLTGYRFCYRVKIEYRIDFKPVASMTMDLNVSSPRALTNHRSIKKMEAKKLIDALPKNLLQNGTVHFEPVCYIGFFKRK